jgi:hypothetical protein
VSAIDPATWRLAVEKLPSKMGIEVWLDDDELGDDRRFWVTFYVGEVESVVAQTGQSATEGVEGSS